MASVEGIGQVAAGAGVQPPLRVTPPPRAQHAVSTHLRPSHSRTESAEIELDRLTGSRQVGGNRLRLLVNGAQSFPQREANIREADVVLMKTYNFRTDATGRRMAALLTEKARSGAKVYLQFDLRGFYVRDAQELQRVSRGRRSVIPPLLQPLVDAGGVVIPTHSDAKPPRTLRETKRWTGPLAVLSLLLAFVNPFFLLLPLVNVAYNWLATRGNAYFNATAQRDHEKYLITWKQGGPVKVIMGGMNVGDEWARGGTDRGVPRFGGRHGFRDTDIEGTGPFAEAVLAEYLKDVQHNGIPPAGAATSSPQAAADALRETVATMRSPQYRTRAFPWAPQGALVRFVANDPHAGLEGQTIEQLFIASLGNVPAGETVRISVPFFAPTKAVRESMRSATRRGVKLRILLNSRDVADPGMRLAALGAQQLYRTIFDDFPKDSVEIYELHAQRRNAERFGALHQKMYIFGERGPVVTGSSNLDTYSLRWNTEGVLAIDDATLHQEATRLFEQDLRLPGVERARRPQETLVSRLAHALYDWPVKLAQRVSETRPVP